MPTASTFTAPTVRPWSSWLCGILAGAAVVLAWFWGGVAAPWMWFCIFAGVLVSGGFAPALLAGLGAWLIATFAAPAPAGPLMVALVVAWATRRRAERRAVPMLALLSGIVFALISMDARLTEWCVGSAFLAMLWLIPRLLAPSASLPRGCMTLINTITGQGTYFLACLIFPPVSPLLLLFGRHRRTAVAACLRMGARAILASPPFIIWRWSGPLPTAPAVIIGNHESVLDILAALAVPGRRRILLAKPWVFRTPLLGQVARLGGMMPLDALDEGRLVNQSPLPDHADVVVFPEGARSRDGRLARFRRGAMQMARDLHRPLVLMLNVGTGRVLAPGRPWIRPGLLGAHLTPLNGLPPEPHRSDVLESATMHSGAVRSQVLDDTDLTPDSPRALREIVRERLLAARIPPVLHWLSALDRLECLAHAGWRARWGCWNEERRGYARRALERLPLLADGAVIGLDGIGWGCAALALRQVRPDVRFVCRETDPRRRRAAQTWMRSTDVWDDAGHATADWWMDECR